MILSDVAAVWEGEAIAVLVDEEAAAFLTGFDYDVLIDATMMKKAKPPLKEKALPGRLVIGVGPGFRAPDGVDAVVESNRGHDMGRVIWGGEARALHGRARRNRRVRR